MLHLIGSINRGELKKAIDHLIHSHPDVRKVLLISPIVDDYQFIHRNYPQFDIYITRIDDWDLNHPCALQLGIFDLAIASNVMMSIAREVRRPPFLAPIKMPCATATVGDRLARHFHLRLISTRYASTLYILKYSRVAAMSFINLTIRPCIW